MSMTLPSGQGERSSLNINKIALRFTCRERQQKSLHIIRNPNQAYHDFRKGIIHGQEANLLNKIKGRPLGLHRFTWTSRSKRLTPLPVS